MCWDFARRLERVTIVIPAAHSQHRAAKRQITIELMNVRVTLTCLVLACVSFGLFVFRIGNPPIYVIDECYYVPAAKSFLAGNSDGAPQHPPLGKMIIAAGIRVAGDHPAGWRVASAFFGSITLVAVTLWTYLLVEDLGLAMFAAILTLFNNFLYVMARVAMLDVFYFAFVMLGVLAFTRVARGQELSLLTNRALIVCTWCDVWRGNGL